MHPFCRWKTPRDFGGKFSPDGRLCNEVMRMEVNEPLVIRNLPETPYASSDPNVMRYGLKTYVGHQVRAGGVVVGTLCVVYTDDREFAPDELATLGALAGALGIEEERHTIRVDLEGRMRDIEKFNDFMFGREKRILEIKMEVNRLLKELGREEKYKAGTA